MGKRRRLNQKMVNVETSSTLSLLELSSKREKAEQVDEAGPSKKKMKTEELKTLNSQDQTHVVTQAKEVTILDLPLEMLMEILNGVRTHSLFSCRRVSRQWNQLSSQVLRKRSENKIQFGFHNNKAFLGLSFSNRGKSLQDFVQCFKESKNVPFAHFYFDIKYVDFSSSSTFFENKEWTAFLSDFPTSKINGFKLKIDRLHDVKSSERFVAKFGELVLNKMPHLEEFGLHLSYVNLSSSFKFFPTTEENSAPIQLAGLKVVYADCFSFSRHAGVFKQILTAAVNLKKIEPFEFFGNHGNKLDAQNFQFLHSLGKIHCLQKAEISLTPEFLSAVKQIGKSRSLKLKEVSLKTGSIFQNPNTWADASNFISNLFKSSKTTLTSLTLEPLAFLNGLKLPTFQNLVKLTLIQSLDDKTTLPPQIFSRGIRRKNVFPTVRFLDVDTIERWFEIFPHKNCVPPLPNVESLIVTDYAIGKSCISKIARLCPNLKRLKIVRNDFEDPEPPQLNFLQVGRAIWTHMKQLETLEIDVDLDSPENNNNNRMALDSCFTGISEQNCQRLYEVNEAKNALKKWGVQFQILDSGNSLKLEPEVEREHASILDMKDLKQLTVNSYSGAELQKQTDFFTENLTWISQVYAFKLMPQLKIKRARKM